MNMKLWLIINVAIIAGVVMGATIGTLNGFNEGLRACETLKVMTGNPK